ncbi:MAG: stage II sporulation protein R [bacterium]
MKQIVIFLFCITIVGMYQEGNNIYSEEYMLPVESIRMRIVANSNEAGDQIIKYDLLSEITHIISNIEKNSNTIYESRELISTAIPLIENKLSELSINANVNYGMNYFPEKNYNNIVYGAGEYESLVITIGSGIGENWWCVLFPPLCLMEVNKNEVEEVEYSMYIKNIINKYF